MTGDVLAPNGKQKEKNTRRRRDHITIFEWVVEHLSGDEPARVCDVGHEERAVLVRCLAEGCVVPVARICGSAADNEAGLEDPRLRCEACIVDEVRRGVERVWEGLEVDGGSGDLLFCGL